MKYARELNSDEILELIFIYLTEVSSLRDYDDIIEVLAKMGRALTSADRCTIWLISDDRKTIWTKVAHGIKQIKVPIYSGVVGDSIKNEKKIIIDDAYEDKRFNSDVDKVTGYKTKSMMVIPMFDNNDEIIGAFQAINHRGIKGVFNEYDMKRLMLASTYAAETLVSAKLIKEIEDTQKEVVFTMGEVGESRSKETGNHVKRVAEYSKILALGYGFSQEEAELLKQASPMHDIGKIAIPDIILNKPGRFTDKEREIMNTHAELGYNMIKSSQRPLLKAASIVAHEHHEKWDGTGYPQGKKGENIHIYGRITAVADVFDALGSDRVYKKAWDDEKIFKLFEKEKGKQFDPKIIDVFFNNLDEIFKVRDKFNDEFKGTEKKEQDKFNTIKVLGAYGAKANGFGTSSFLLNDTTILDAGNILVGLEDKLININSVWLTHSHLDHILDIAYFIDIYYESIKDTIKIFALPATIKAMKKNFMNNILWPDFSKIKLYNKNKMCIEYIEIELDQEYKISDRETIKPFKTFHTVPSCGYIYTKDNSSILITADTNKIDNVLELVNNEKSIKSIVLECSFPSNKEKLANNSMHLTPKMLSEELKGLKRDDINLYINHIKPQFINEITDELLSFCTKWSPKIVKDGQILQF